MKVAGAAANFQVTHGELFSGTRMATLGVPGRMVQLVNCFGEDTEAR